MDYSGGGGGGGGDDGPITAGAIPPEKLAGLFCGGPLTRQMVVYLRHAAETACAYVVLHVSIGTGAHTSVVHMTHTPTQTCTSGAQNRRMMMALYMPCRPGGHDLTSAQRAALKRVIDAERNHRGRALMLIECAMRSDSTLGYHRELVLTERDSAAHVYALWVALALRAWPTDNAMRSPLCVNDTLVRLLGLSRQHAARAACRNLLSALSTPPASPLLGGGGGGGDAAAVPVYVEPPESTDELPQLSAASRAFVCALGATAAAAEPTTVQRRARVTQTALAPASRPQRGAACIAAAMRGRNVTAAVYALAR